MRANRWIVPLLTLALLSSASGAATYYVDFAGGADTAAGTSPATAWQHCPGDADATDVPAATTLAGGDTVIFKGGVHYRGAIRLDDASGAAGNPIVLDGNTAGTFGTGRAVIDGSERLAGWTACTGPDDGGNNPNWQHVYKIPLPAGVTLFTANLYEGDALLAMAQDPDVPDPMFYDDLDTFNAVDPSAVTDTDTEVTITDPTYFTQTDPTYWDGGFVHVWHNPNVVSTLAVTGFDPATDTIITEPLGGGNIYPDKDTLYAMANCLAILDGPGEYVINETTGMIYLWPLCEADPDTVDVTVSVRECGLEVYGEDHITLRGFKVIRHAADFGGYHSGVGIRSRVGTTGLTVRDNEVTQNRSMEKYGAIYVAGGTDVIIEDNNVHHNMRNKGIFTSGLTNGAIRDNIVHRNGSTGIGLYTCTGGEVRGNLVTEQVGVHANGITLYLECDGVHVVGNTVRDGLCALTTQDANNLTIAYNVFHTNIDGYTVADWNSSTRPSYNLHYYNNVIINHHTTGMSVGEHGRDGLIVRNNIIDGAGIGCGDNISHNIYTSLMWSQKSQYGWSLGTGEIVETDKTLVYVDDANHDYHLVTGSPGIDAGTDVGYSEDLDGTAVPYNGTVDIGAYEYTGPTDNVPPVADAGADQEVTDTDGDGSETVTLDGSGSSDADGTIAGYVWEEASTQLATGVTPQVDLDVNVHTIDLTVTDDDDATDTDSVVVTVLAGGVPTLTVEETAGDYYTLTAHDAADPQIAYWEIKVDIQSGAIFSFKDLTDDGDGAGGHTSYLDTDAYGRQCSLIFFDGRGGNVLTRSNPLDDLATHLTFDAATDGSSFTITYTEDASTTDWFHDSYGTGGTSLSPGELETTIELVITPPDETGTAWDWTLTSTNVSAHDITQKVWAEEYVSGYLHDGIDKTFDYDESFVDGAWNDAAPVSYMRWTIGSNPSLGLTAGREIIIDRQSALAGFDQGGTVAQSTWAGFAHGRYKSAFDYSTALPAGSARITTGQVLINITAP
ncbi:MAG: right-handed parallel beta-helix repeat-containing protein [Planctomycetota bacterium]